MEDLFLQQYQLVCGSRAKLLEYCGTLTNHDFIVTHDNFGQRSIRHLLVHVANVYQSWIGHFAEMDTRPVTEIHDIRDVIAASHLYNAIDAMVNTFIDKHAKVFFQPITNTVPHGEMKLSVTPLELFTHVVTHEFHHKGQILSMSRQLGYTPIDTDVIRFE